MQEQLEVCNSIIVRGEDEMQSQRVMNLDLFVLEPHS